MGRVASIIAYFKNVKITQENPYSYRIIPYYTFTCLTRAEQYSKPKLDMPVLFMSISHFPLPRFLLPLIFLFFSIYMQYAMF